MVGTFTFMLVATMVKDLAEDYYRWKADHELNCSETRVLRDGALVVVQWREIIVGDIVQIRRDEAIPADLFYLSSSDQKHGQCFIDTCQLDGETNLKAHLALAATKNLATPEAVGGFTGAVESEAPHAGLYKYSGKLEIGGDVKLLGPSQVRVVLRLFVRAPRIIRPCTTSCLVPMRTLLIVRLTHIGMARDPRTRTLLFRTPAPPR